MELTRVELERRLHALEDKARAMLK
jgi:hypothetical protein